MNMYDKYNGEDDYLKGWWIPPLSAIIIGGAAGAVLWLIIESITKILN